LKKAAGVPAVVGDGGRVIVQKHRGERWIVEFLEEWEGVNAFRLCAEWKKMANEVDAELAAAESAEEVFAAAGVVVDEPQIEWIRKQLT
jgi:hypothetical protein